MEIYGQYVFEESYIPPRCRKPRTRIVQGEAEYTIKEISLIEAPIAMRYPAYDFEKESFQCGRCVLDSYDYRVYNNTLYRREWEHAFQDGITVGKKWAFLSHLVWMANREYYPRKTNKEDAIAQVQGELSRYIIIDGELWVRASEPMYVVMTFGLGHNHASTDLMIEEHGYNPNISSERYFNALQYDEALASALDVAAKRGDTNSFDSIRTARKIEVLIPEMVRALPKKEAGPGSTFLNDCEDFITGSANSTEAGLLVMLKAVKG